MSSHLAGVLRYPAEPRVLLLRSDRVWRRPRVVVREPMWMANMLVVVPAFERRLGTRPWLPRHLGFTQDEETRRLDAVHELELVDAGWRQPAHGRWAELADLDRLRLGEEERELLTP